MSVDKDRTLKFLLLLLATAALTGCGTSTKNTEPVIVPSTASLTGNYVFTAQGNEDDGAYFVAGTFVADGKGNISSGIADYNLPGGIDSAVQLTGTYTVAASGAGTVNLTDGAGTQDTFAIQFVSAGMWTVSAFDSTGTGTLSSITGAPPTTYANYTFTLSGQGYGTVAASGNFTTNALGSITTGMESYSDANLAETVDNLSGFLGTPESNRGYALIGGNAFSYYMQAPNQIVLVGLDDRVLLYGTAMPK